MYDTCLVEIDNNRMSGKVEFWRPIEEKFSRTLGNWKKLCPSKSALTLSTLVPESLPT